ncbi:DNA polymerase delta catalytic subunit [Cavenderia fasciculata]|uniref:DNA polymerase n=1 Tax=Cavenderia fasciculata TaxID=261658 RepID=F4QFP5_CACFS|nr:DNA polymerase delta catalytic subunit [Cavenderia fasciculata]EGG13498.1 DNA polymerase delta catalytic subunit [Cavenderia fasciculata]|eukprot:XP_004350202.1 DNA polymerase delta catalytic subunit [Cavenderia fasciculata]
MGRTEFSFIQVPQRLGYLYLIDNNLQSFSSNLPNTLRTLVINFNANFKGPITESFCGITDLDIRNTSVPSLPDCFLCYYNGSQKYIYTDLVAGCPITINNKDNLLITQKNIATITGNNIGYGSSQSNYTISQVIPNQELIFKYTGATPLPYIPTQVTINLNPHTVKMMIVKVDIYVGQPTGVQIKNNTIINFTLDYSPYFNHTITIDNSTACTNLTNIASNQFQCTTPLLSNGDHQLVVSNSYTQSEQVPFTFYSLAYICEQSTNNCHGNRKCDDGICICNSNSFYNDCLKPYPIISSGNYNSTNNKNVELNGDFGPSISNTSHNNKLSQFQINCTLDQQPSFGLASVQLKLNNHLITLARNILNLKSPQPQQPSDGVTKSDCESNTFNCYGHGYCDDSGKCQCQNGYSDIDNCLTKYINRTIHQIQPTPTVSFDIDGLDFLFEVLSTISFSTLARTVEFGGKQLLINANSIKLEVNISKWQYSSNLSTLRVVFKTLINNNQSIQYDCIDKDISTFSYDSLSSLQYLRVVKDGIQFNGRFIDVALSDGRPTYSPTQLISSTPINDEQSISILDPDFGALVINPDGSGKCDDVLLPNHNWKIIMIVVCVSFVSISIIFVAVKVLKKKVQFKLSKRLNKSFKSRGSSRGSAQMVPIPKLNTQQQINMKPVQSIISDWISFEKEERMKRGANTNTNTNNNNNTAQKKAGGWAGPAAGPVKKTKYQGGGEDDEYEEEEEEEEEDDVDFGGDDDDDAMDQDEDADGVNVDDDVDMDGSQQQQLQLWSRKPVPDMHPLKDNFIFQQLEVDYCEVKEPLSGMPGPKTGPVPVVRLFGITKTGNSVLCKVHGFLPYFFIACPPGFTVRDCKEFRETLDEVMFRYTTNNNVENIILGIEIVKKKSILGYNPNPLSDFIKITLAMPRYVTKCRDILENGMRYGYNVPTQEIRVYQTFESNIPFALRFLIDKKVPGCSWVELPAGGYQISQNKVSTCQIEVDTSIDDFMSHPINEQWSDIAPFRILSFDIECAGRKGVFPEPGEDPVIQIANLVKNQGESEPFIKNVFTLKGCSNIVGAHVLTHPDEKSLLREWRKFIIKVDPDIIIGYNIANFDLPYLIERSRALKIGDFSLLSRIKTTHSKIKKATFSSQNLGTREGKEVSMPGRTQLDIIQAIQRDHKLSSYSLNNVSAHFLKEQKEDVHYSIIADLQNGTDDDRRRLAVYCIKDAQLPLKLLDKLMILINYAEMSRVTGVPLSYLLGRGEGIKVVSQLYRKAMEEDLLLPTKRVSDVDVSFQGAYVIDPQVGFYDEPIATLDFTSLYPSIMMAHNLCYTTLLTAADKEKVDPNDYTLTPSGSAFIKPSHRKGILPKILEELLGARKKAKDDLKNEKDPFKRAVLDGRQLALKISANSVYGFTGARVGKLPCLDISRSVTAFGRVMLDTTKNYVENTYTIANGYENDAKIIYGDTDSVMVKFGVKTVAEAIELGRKASKEITAKCFIRPINLDFEKVYYPYLLINKKRYAGLFWTKTDTHDKMDVKGLEVVRRDNCPLVRMVISTVLNKILIDKDIKSAEEFTKDIVSDLLQNKIDISMLVITKALSKNDYKGKVIHNEVALKMRALNPSTAPVLGDRVPFVITQGIKNAPLHEKAHDPLHVLENNIQLDTKYYCDHQLRGPLMRIFEPILANPESIFTGDHTRSVHIQSAPPTKSFFSSLEKKRKCMACPNELAANESSVCKDCRNKEADLYQTSLQNLTNLENQFSQTWTQCQRCSGSLHQPVLCSNRDCPIFYLRTKVQKDLTEARRTVEKFSIEW